MNRLAESIWNIPSGLLIASVRLYQGTLSPLLGRRCRFDPSCSSYFILAVQKHGAVLGALRGLWRICRCHPFHPGGYDPP
jgi:putative membrane protein insertion efficiency factor